MIKLDWFKTYEPHVDSEDISLAWVWLRNVAGI
jgi:hypothetical protein